MATDPLGLVESIEVAINVIENSPPVAIDDSTSVVNETFGPGLAISAVTIDVLANDDDPDGDPLYLFQHQTKTDHGTISLGVTSGSVIYIPNTDFAGVDEFSYTIIDGTLGAGTPKLATAKVAVVVYRPPDGIYDNTTTELIHPDDPGPVSTPHDDVEVSFPPNPGGGRPFQVQVNWGVTPCGSGPPDKILIACAQVDLYDLRGTIWDASIPTPFTTAEMTIAVPDTKGTSMYRRSGAGVPWSLIPMCDRVLNYECFNVSAMQFMVQNITNFSQFAVTRPRSGQRPIGGGGSGGGGGGGGITPQATPTVAPTPTPQPTPTPTVAPTPTTQSTPTPTVAPTPTPQPTPAETDAPTPTPDPSDPTLTRPASTSPGSQATRSAGSAGPTATPTPVGARTMGSSGSTPELPLIVPSATAPPAPASTRPAAPGDTPAPIAALSPTSGPTTTALPSGAVEDRGFPLWLWILIAAAVLLLVVLLYTSRRLLRRT